MRDQAWKDTQAIAAVLNRYGVEGVVWRMGLTVLCTMGMFLPKFTVGECTPLYGISHANVFHFIANIYCLWLIKIPLRWVLGILISILVAYIPCPVWSWGDMAFVDIPTCGLSGFIICALGMAWGEKARIGLTMKMFFLPIFLISLIPNMNLLLHMYCALGGWVVGLIIKFYDNKQQSPH